MNSAVSFRMLCAASLFIFSTTQTVIASESPAAVEYQVRLQVPPGLRPLLENNLDLYRWHGSDRTTDVQLKRLIRLAPVQIRELLATEGFYSPQVKSGLISQDGNWIVDLDIEPGETTRVASVDLEITGVLNKDPSRHDERLARIKADWRLSPGTVFRQDDWESAKRNALKLLVLDQFPSATISDSVAEVDPGKQSVRLRVTLDSGPLVTFGSLQIEGLQRYPESIIRNLNPIKAGDPYAQGKLLDLQTRLQDSPYFSQAYVSVDNASATTDEMPIRVDVTEQPSKKLGFGLGMSTDTGARGQMNYRDLNFLGRAWVLSSTIKLDQKSQSLGGDILLPPTGKDYRDSLSVLGERTDIEGLESRKMVLGGKRSFVKGKTETVYGLRYWEERQLVGNATSTRNSALSLSSSWTQRNVDNLLFPTQGYVINLQADGALRELLSTQDFVRGFGRGVYFLPLSTRDQFIFRGELGMVAAKSRKGIPSDFLFRTGGDQTVRGYAYQSLGVAEASAIVGGRYLAVVSAEYVHWLSDKWGMAAFIDKGNATDSLRDLKLVTGYGLGARWKSPVGPLNVDVAYGQDVHKMRLHFSVGFTF